MATLNKCNYYKLVSETYISHIQIESEEHTCIENWAMNLFLFNSSLYVDIEYMYYDIWE